MLPVRSARRTRQGVAGVFAIPALLLFTSIAGLIIGLTGDGLPDLFAIFLLSLPLIAIGFGWMRRR